MGIVSLPNSWKAMSMTMSNFIRKLMFEDIQDLILAKEMCRRDFGEITSLCLTLNVDTWDREHNRTSFGNKSKSKLRSRQQMICWNCDKTGHIKTTRIQRKPRMTLWMWWLKKYMMLYSCSAQSDWWLGFGFRNFITYQFTSRNHEELYL